jgi:hypothetical protein
MTNELKIAGGEIVEQKGLGRFPSRVSKNAEGGAASIVSYPAERVESAPSPATHQETALRGSSSNCSRQVTRRLLNFGGLEFGMNSESLSVEHEHLQAELGYLSSHQVADPGL